MKKALRSTGALRTFCVLAAFSVCFSLGAQWDKDVFSMRGRQALSEGRYSTAIENFNILARLDTADYWNFFWRGIAKYNLGDVRGAYGDFDRSVRLNPVFTNGYHYRAIAESRSGDFDNAIKDLETAISLRPGFSGLYFSRGVTYFLAQRFTLAVEDFDRYIHKEPKDPSAYLNRGACRLFLGDTLKALTDYNKAIKLDRFEAESYVRRGLVYAGQKKYPDAIADLDKAIELDSTSTFAYFNRAILNFELQDYNAAMRDLDRVLEDEPGNALTLYNRSLVNARVGNLEEALEDMDRVININPGNVLARFNRASIFVEMERWKDALDDYDKAIELYPDFAKAYLNRSYVKQRMGRYKESKADYETASRKVREYREKASGGAADFADTTKKYSSLLALDADFAKKDFNDELLQHRDIDIKLRPLYRFTLCRERDAGRTALSGRYENALLDKFTDEFPSPVRIANSEEEAAGTDVPAASPAIRKKAYVPPPPSEAQQYFEKGLKELADKQFSSALSYFDKAVGAAAAEDGYKNCYKAFYLMNRGVLKAEMIDFIASLEGKVQTLSMDDSGTTRARVSDRVGRNYDYSEAIADIRAALEILPDNPHVHFNLGNLDCLSSDFVGSVECYDKAISLYPGMGDAYFNRGLVLIYLKDKEKGCIDLSRSGELGVAGAYGVIKKYCKNEE
ncbi:MAG: tetratricopeptide repeat protein [Bacteroidales bacterium]|nr:tetratricopeptide repeat protein [Bacteroidales bacterium]